VNKLIIAYVVRESLLLDAIGVDPHDAETDVITRAGFVPIRSTCKKDVTVVPKNDSSPPVTARIRCSVL
jgi:hypothetical protein